MRPSNLLSRTAGNGVVGASERGWHLGLPATTGDRYDLAQVDDYWGRTRGQLLWRPPLIMRLRARVSSREIDGTWGFGLWNDPFGFALDPTRHATRLPALPQAAWFFFASRRSYLSFRDDKPAYGFMAQAFRSERAGPWLAGAVLTFPFSLSQSRRLLGRHIAEDAASVHEDPLDWHQYEIGWGFDSSAYSIDGRTIFRTDVTPRGPLAIVMWIDNQYAAFDRRGKLSWGLEKNSAGGWLEIEDLTCSDLAADQARRT